MAIIREGLSNVPLDLSFFIVNPCSLFHSITMDGKKEFRRYSCLTLNKWMLLWLMRV